MRREDKLYEYMYGDIPNTQEERIKYILGKHVGNQKIVGAIGLAAKQLKKIKYSEIQFTMWKIPRPAARPRFRTIGGHARTHVPRAKEEGDWFEEYAKESNLPTIETPCEMTLTVYTQTPKSFTIKKKVLAELGLWRPWNNTGDFDNYAKSFADAIQHGMLKNDALVVDGHQHLYYSVKPHAVVKFRYMNKFPEV